MLVLSRSSPFPVFFFSVPSTTCESLAFYEDLGHIFSISCSLSTPGRPPSCLFFYPDWFFRIFPYRESFGLFLVLSKYQKTVDSPHHRRGYGRETNRLYILFTLGLFPPIPHHILSIVRTTFHCIGFLSRILMEWMRCFGDCGVVGWLNESIV